MAFFSSLFLSLFMAAVSTEKPKSTLRVFCLEPQALIKVRQKVTDGDVEIRPAFEKLLSEAGEAMESGPFSVMDKTSVAPSGDKHDYMSLGPYWWPDPDKPDGKPYIRRDGQVNPETSNDATDRPAFGRMNSAVGTLALAYYLTGQEKYAARAALLLRTWFLNTSTRMNPHLQYGQAIPGRVDGRGIGIIDTARLPDLIDAVGMIESSSHWTSDDDRGLKQWMDAYLTWLLNSPYGRDEAQTKNNHGTWYDAQVASLALYVSKPQIAREILLASRERRIAAQIRPDGSQPHELARTKSFGYSVMNLRGMFQLASLARHVNVDLWNYSTPDGRNIRRALDYLAPIVNEENLWSYEQIGGPNRISLLDLLRRGARAYNEPRYEELIGKLDKDDVASSRSQLLYPGF